MSKKLFGILASFALVLSLVGANTASALTASDIAMLQAAGIISASQAASLSASIAVPTTTTSSHTFAKDLTVGSRGADVTALQNLLGVSPATGYFGNLTKAAVIKYQLQKGIQPAAGYVGPKTRSIINASSGVVVIPGTTIPTGTTSGTDLAVSLAATSPVTGALVAGQAIADLAEYTFTNTSATPAVVTNVTLQRGGISNDAILTNIYLYNGVNRLTDAASISSGKITFNAGSAGLFTVPAGSSMTIAVRSDIASGTTYNGQILVVSLTGVTSNLPVAASLPVSGASQTVSSASIATVVVASSSPSTASINPQTDYIMWQGTATVGTNDVWLKAFALRQVGTVTAGDLGNFRLYIDGTRVGNTLTAYDANGFLTFDLSATPFKLTAAGHTIKLIGDIIGGSGKNFSFSLRQASDINTVDSQLNVNVLATASVAFPMTSGVQSVSAGSLTITKATDSPSGSVTLLSNGVSLAKFTIKAAGEPVKIETLYVRMAPGAVTQGSIRNGAIYANGSQIGSTADISSSTAGTLFSFGSSLVVYPGTPVTLEVKGDIYDNVGTQNFANGSTLTVSLVGGSSNADLVTSLGTYSTPATSGNQLTVSQGSASLSKQGAYANQSIVSPKTNALLGSYTLTAGTTENLNVNTVTVNFSGSAASTTATTASNVTDVYFTFGNAESNHKASIVAGDNDYQVNYSLAAGQTQTINVYGTISSAIGATDVINTKVRVSGQTANSVQTVSAPGAATYITGQTITMTTGVLTPSVYALAASSTVIGGNLVKAGSFQFVATGDNFVIDQLTGSVPLAAAGNVASVIYKINGQALNTGTPVDTSDDTNANATTTGLTIAVPANGTVIVDAYLQLASVGTPGQATSSTNVKFTLIGYEKMSSTGVLTQIGADTATYAGNVQYVYASVPTISTQVLPETGSLSLSAGTKTLSRIKISADAAGAIDWGMIQFHITKPAGVSLGTTTANDLSGWTLTDDAGNIIPGTFASTTANLEFAGTTGDLRFTATNPETISAGSSKIYRLKTDVSGVIAANDSVTTKIVAGTTSLIAPTTFDLAKIQAGAATTVTFTWSDRSFSPHSVSKPDWNNGTLVTGIPTDTQAIIN